MNPVFYTVKEVAKKLNTKEDTVRRWIYDEKLKSEIHSKKAGHMISPEELSRFLKEYPKYAARYVGLAPTSPVALGAFMAGILGGVMVLANNKKNPRVTADDVKKSVETKIANLERELAEKKDQFKKLSAEIEAHQETLDRYLMMASQLDAETIADQINSNIQITKEDT